MDNLCHTLVGAALGEAGLRKKTPLAMATLLIGANLPDVDAGSYAWGRTTALGFRRGWTHGVLAMAVLPVVLAGAALAWDRLVRRRRSPAAEPALPVWLLVLAALSVWTHPLLDFLNTYGVRWLMPFSDRWYYGDTLFIVDPWIWLMLGSGVWLTRHRARRGRPGALAPARLGLAATAAYVALMGAGTLAGRRMAAGMLPGAVRFMVAPVPVLPVVRHVVADLGDRYEHSTVMLFPRPGVTGAMEAVGTGRARPEALTAARTPEGRVFLRWARFPVFRVEREGPAAVVAIGDERYPGQPWASVSIRTTQPVSLRPISSAEHP
jgi:inner membrane protein